MKQRFVFVLSALIVFIMLPAVGFGAYVEDDQPFGLGHENGLEVPRVYAGLVSISAESDALTNFIFRTENTSADGDPVMFLREGTIGGTVSDGAHIAAADDNYFGYYNFSKDPEIVVTLDPGESKLVQVIITSFDEDHTGQTDLTVWKSASGSAHEYQRIEDLRFGSTTVMAPWWKGDVIRTVGHHRSETLEAACEDELGGEWDFTARECDVGSRLSAEVVCQVAYLSLEYNAVYPHGSRCESTTLARDTVLIAAQDWGKEHAIRASVSTANGGVDDDGGTGTNAKLTMPGSTSEADFPAIVVGLYPWNDSYRKPSLTGGDEVESPVTDDRIRLYRDMELWSYYQDGYLQVPGDADRDGLSDALEQDLGLDPYDPDTDTDTIIDGFEVYGTDDLPLPSLGADPQEKDLIVEVDWVEGRELTTAKREAIRAAGYALDEADIHLMALTGEYSTYEVTVCSQTCMPFQPCNTICAPQDVPVLPRFNKERQVPTTAEDPTNGVDYDDECDADCLEDASGFDFAALPFVKRVAWTYTEESCGTAHSKNELAQHATVKCTGSSFTHELGHLLILGHGGVGVGDQADKVYKPNYWSVMNYEVDLPQPGYGGLVPMETKQTHQLGDMRARPARFSSRQFIDLDENALTESDGLTGGQAVEFGDIRDPANPGSESSPNWTDLNVSWLDWNLDSQLSSDNDPVVKNIDRRCEPDGNKWINENNDDEEGDTRAVCREVLESDNDITYLRDFWPVASSALVDIMLDAERVAMDLPPTDQYYSTSYTSTTVEESEVVSCQ